MVQICLTGVRPETRLFGDDLQCCDITNITSNASRTLKHEQSDDQRSETNQHVSKNDSTTKTTQMWSVELLPKLAAVGSKLRVPQLFYFRSIHTDFLSSEGLLDTFQLHSLSVWPLNKVVRIICLIIQLLVWFTVTVSLCLAKHFVSIMLS